MNLFKLSLFSYLFFFAFAVCSQGLSDSIKQLPVIEVSPTRLSAFSSGNKTETFDSTLLDRYSTSNLADLLANESQVFIKSYGLGSLATTSFRGAGASQTAVLWNGFNLQSPMHGMLDMSLVPTNFCNDVKLQYGGAGALCGSGAVGGTIHLNNDAKYDRGISVAATTAFGSFSDKLQQASIEISKKRFVTSIKIFNHDAKNDFPFINTAQSGKPEQKQSNADLKQYGLLQENYFQINTHQKINTRFWYQYSDRNIPPSMTQNRNAAFQQDESVRATTEWQRTGEKRLLLARVAYFDEKLRYNDSLINMNSLSRSKVFIAEAENRFSLTKFDLINIGINNTHSTAVSKDFINDPKQNRFAVFASYKIHTANNDWNAVVSARQEFIESKAVPFNLSVGSEGKFLRRFTAKANIAQHYRVPTFNDLYWAQGGNPDLKPESGWSEELSLIHKYEHKAFAWEFGATIFNRTIDNWIIWLPNPNGNWSPENVLKVWSRGIEYKLKANYSLGELNLQLSGMYNYVLSTNEKTATANDEAIGKQLIYVPIQNAQSNFSISFKGATLMYTQLYTDYRYILSDNTEYLKPYTIGNLNMAQTFSLHSSKIKVFVQLNNIWNETYQILAYRAMPLLNYQFGLTLYFNQQNKKEQ